MVSDIFLFTRWRSLVLLIDRNATALDEGLSLILPQISAKHQVMSAAVTDPCVDQITSGWSLDNHSVQYCSG